MRAVTSSDVARHAGVSRATVSYVLSEGASAMRISKETRERVLLAAAELGYTPNRAAQSLRRMRTGVLAYVHAGAPDYFNSHLLYGIQLAAQERGFVFASFTVDSAEALQRTIGFLGGRGADGVITQEYEGLVYEALAKLAQQGLPLVTQGVSSDPGIPAVGFDLEAGGFLATSHLLELGHTRIGYIAADVPPWPSPELYPERHAGYLRAHAAAGIEPRPEWHVVASPTPDGASQAIRRLLALPHPRPTAVFVHNDWMALGALQALYEANVRVPDEMAVVGFDGLDLGEVAVPPLSTVELPCSEFGRRAVEIISELLDDRPAPPTDLLVPRLIERASSALRREEREPGEHVREPSAL